MLCFDGDIREIYIASHDGAIVSVYRILHLLSSIDYLAQNISGHMATQGTFDASTGETARSHPPSKENTTDQPNYLSATLSQGTEHHPRLDFYNDTNIQFEEYQYWASLTREAEKATQPEEHGLFGLFKRKSNETHGEEPATVFAGDNEKDVVANTTNNSQNAYDTLAVTDSEWHNARGAMRTATWGGYTC